MDWGSEDMTETDDSEYEDPVDRANRLYVESCNYDLSEGMTPMTYTPPLRKNRRRRYEVRTKNETDIEESICGTIDESPNSEQMVQPRTVADEDILTVSDRKDNCGGRTRTGNDEDITSDSKLFGQPVTESATGFFYGYTGNHTVHSIMHNHTNNNRTRVFNLNTKPNLYTMNNTHSHIRPLNY